MATDSDVLAYNPWGFDESDYRVLKNVMVTTRKVHLCDLCFEMIPAGTRSRAQSEIFEGDAKTFRFCPACCEAMGRCVSHDDPDGLEVEARMELGRNNAEARRNVLRLTADAEKRGEA